MENMLDKLIITALRGKTAAVLFKDGHAAQIDFKPEAAEEETGVIFVGKVKNISKNIMRLLWSTGRVSTVFTA